MLVLSYDDGGGDDWGVLAFDIGSGVLRPVSAIDAKRSAMPIESRRIFGV
jgi:hypothetical protein